MGFFNKLKQGLGFDTASIKFIETPAEISSSTKEITGKVTVTAQSDQKVNSIQVILTEKHTKVETNGETYAYSEPDKDIAVTILDGFDLKQGETRTIPFTLVFKSAVVANPLVMKIKYELQATADLEHVALDPVVTQKIKII